MGAARTRAGSACALLLCLAVRAQAQARAPAPAGPPGAEKPACLVPWGETSARAAELRRSGAADEAYRKLREGSLRAEWEERGPLWLQYQRWAIEDGRPESVVEAAERIWRIEARSDAPFLEAAAACLALGRRPEAWLWFWRGFSTAGSLPFRQAAAAEGAFERLSASLPGDPDLAAARWILRAAARKRGEPPPAAPAAEGGALRFLPSGECLSQRAYALAAELADALDKPGAGTTGGGPPGGAAASGQSREAASRGAASRGAASRGAALRERAAAVQRYYYSWRECAEALEEGRLDPGALVGWGAFSSIAPQSSSERALVGLYDKAAAALKEGSALFGGAKAARERSLAELTLVKALALTAVQRNIYSLWTQTLAVSDARRSAELSFESTAYVADRAGTAFSLAEPPENCYRVAREAAEALETLLGPDHPLFARALMAEGEPALGGYSSAEPFIRAASILEACRRPSHPDLLSARVGRALFLSHSRSYAKAVEEIESVLVLIGDEGPRRGELGLRIQAILADALQVLGRAQEGMGRLREAELSYERSISSRGDSARESLLRLPSLAALGSLYMGSKEYARAVECWGSGISLLSELHGERSLTVYELRRDLGTAAGRLGVHGRAIALLESAAGSSASPSFADPTVYLDLGDALADSGDFEAAIARYAQAGRAEEWMGRWAASLRCRSLAAIALTSARGGMLARSEEACDEAFALLAAGSGTAFGRGEEALCLASLGAARRLAGRHAEALDLYTKALAATTGDGEAERARAARLENDLAGCLSRLGRHREARELLEGVLAWIDGRRAKASGSGEIRGGPALGADRALVLNNLASALEAGGDLAGARSRYEEALASWTAEYGDAHPRIGSCLNNLGCLAQTMGDFEGAKDYHERSLAVRRALPGEAGPGLGRSLNNLGIALFSLGRNAEAEAAYSGAIKTLEGAPGLEDEHALALCNLACLRLAEGRGAEAAPLLGRALESSALRFERELAFLGDAERYGFSRGLATQFELCFALLASVDSPELRELAADQLLLTKAASLDARRGTRARAFASSNPALLEAYDRWADLRRAVSSARSREAAGGSGPMRDESLRSLERKAEDAERVLSAASAAILNGLGRKAPRWRDLRSALAPGEVALEIVRFREYNGQWSEGALYGAIVVGPESTSPDFIMIGGAKALEGELFASWKAVMTGTIAPGERSLIEGRLYDAYWKPIAARVRGSRVAWIAPDGIYSLFNPRTLVDPEGESGARVGDGLSLRFLDSCRDLVLPKAAMESGPSVVVGDPDFDARPLGFAASGRAEPAETSGGPRGAIGRFGGRAGRLPGTALEADFIAEAFTAAGQACVKLTAAEATETAIRGLASPRFLHIATHGFSLEGSPAENTRGLALLGSDAPTPFDDPLERAGLLLAGANEGGDGHEDGFLTAYEAEALRLEGTELVVLSACDTGLGEIRFGEGSLGLDRAFRAAGAGAVVKTLWKIDDEATAVFMGRLYDLILSGLESERAFEEAVSGFRFSNSPYEDPYFWGAFVHVGL